MKLRTLDCKNCAAPLRQEGEKLVCRRACGSVFDIPSDANDIEYERIINAEDYIRLELAKSILELENSYRNQEKINQEKRDIDLRTRRKRLIKVLGIIALFECLSMIIWFVFEAVLFSTVYSVRNKKQRESEAAETAVWDPGYRVTPSDLKGDRKFWNYINSDIIAETKAGYDSRGSVIFSSDEIWGVNKDPEIIDENTFVYKYDTNGVPIDFKDISKGTSEELADRFSIFRAMQTISNMKE